METKLKVFISAYQGNDGSMHETMKDMLDMRDLNYKEVVGSYQGTLEKSFMVDLDIKHLDFFKSMGRLFNQESILFVDAFNQATLIFMDNRDAIFLGEMKQVTESEAKSSEAYTFIPELNIYLMVG